MLALLPLLLVSMAEQKECALESVIQDHHMYIQTDLAAACWRDSYPRMGEGNSYDRFAVGLLKDATGNVFGHGPREFSQVFWHFLRLALQPLPFHSLCMTSRARAHTVNYFDMSHMLNTWWVKPSIKHALNK